jgi:hypothetical protein
MGLVMSAPGSNPKSMAVPRAGIRQEIGESTRRAKRKNNSEICARSNDREVGLIVGGVGEVAGPLAVAFAERGMNVALIFWQQRAALAASIKRSVEQAGRRCLLIPSLEVDRETPSSFARASVETVLQEFGRLDVFISLSEKPFTQGRADCNAQDVSTPPSAVIPNVPLMKAALKEIVN